MKYSLFMIKPCAYDKKDEILNIIGQKLKILATKDIVLDENFLSKLYKNEPNNLYRKINIQFLKNGNACIGIVSGKNAIQDLIEICGDKPLGSLCKDGTIRNRYNPEIDTVKMEDQIFYVNAIHKSDAKDVLDDLQLFLTQFVDSESRKEILTLLDSKGQEL